MNAGFLGSPDEKILSLARILHKDGRMLGNERKGGVSTPPFRSLR